jgi:hypothetical protein
MPSASIVDQLVTPAKPFSLPVQRMSGPASEKINVPGCSDFTSAQVFGQS